MIPVINDKSLNKKKQAWLFCPIKEAIAGEKKKKGGEGVTNGKKSRKTDHQVREGEAVGLSHLGNRPHRLQDSPEASESVARTPVSIL